jgi:hypothetical protein
VCFCYCSAPVQRHQVVAAILCNVLFRA